MNWLHEILRDKECRGNIWCFIGAIIITVGGLCVLVYGLAWTSSVTVTAEDVYQRRHMAEDIEILQNEILHYGELIESIESYDVPRFENHTHKFRSGKVKQETVK